MAGYIDFKENLAIALGRDEAALAKADAESSGVGGDAFGDGGSDPADEIQDQADKIAKAVQRYLYALADGSTYVKAPAMVEATATIIE
jgi:hypothetical protein